MKTKVGVACDRKTRAKCSVRSDLSTKCCPGCLKQGYIEHYLDSIEEDDDGTFENHYVRCRLCGRHSLAMDSEKDAIHAFFNEPDNCAYRPGTMIVCKGNDIYNSFVVEVD